MEAFNHKSVLLKEVISMLNCKDGGFYLDCTVGGGGHSSEILRLIGSKGFLYCLDRDINAIRHAESVLSKIAKNFEILKYSYTNLSLIVEKYNIPLLDGILFDLGVSSPQLDTQNRGFSFSKEAPLDMRFSQDENETPTAEYWVNNLSENELVDIFSKYGEEPYSKTIANGIVKARKMGKIKTTTQLSTIIINSLAGKKFKGNIHPSTRVFQALRIKVNNELDGLKATIPEAIRCLKKGGRLAIITFHSLEDRIVKEVFKEEEKTCICPPKQPICTCSKKATGFIVTKKPIVATSDEISENPRARSAKLRVFEKL